MFLSPIRFIDPDGAAPLDIVFNTIDEYGNKTEVGRIVTDKFDQEFNIDERLIPIKLPKNFEPIEIEVDGNLEKLGIVDKIVETTGVQALSLDISGEAAFQVGLQVEVSLIAIVDGTFEGDWGIALQGNALAGIEASLTGSASAYWPIAAGDLSLGRLRGLEIGAQGSISFLNGAYFEGISPKSDFPFLYRNYRGASLGGTVGIPELGGSGSGYVGFSGYLYRSDKTE